MTLPADLHVHTEFSWDAMDGSMEATCARAVELGVPAVAFTDHADFCGLRMRPEDLDEYPHLRQFADATGTVRPPPLDVGGRDRAPARCRTRFPALTILAGVELGDPHRDPEGVACLLASAPFEHVIASVHSLPYADGYAEPPVHFGERAPDDVVREYFAEIVRMLDEVERFDTLGHLDYAVRYWPRDARPFAIERFEEEVRVVLRALAETGAALEVNTNGNYPFVVLDWWRDEGGDAITFGSDAHSPSALARGFESAVRSARARR